MTARSARAPRLDQAQIWTVEQGGRVLDVVERIVPLARRVSAGIRILAWSGLAATVVILGSVVVIGAPSTWEHVMVLLVLGALLLTPTGVLLLFHGALRELTELPGWLRSSPDLFTNHGAEVVAFVADLRGAGIAGGPGERAGIAGGPGDRAGIAGQVRGRRGFGRDVVRAGKVVLRAHGDLPQYGSMLRLASPPFLIAVAAAFGGLLVEWALAALLSLTATLVVVFA